MPKAIKGAPAIASAKEIPIPESPAEKLPVAKAYAENNRPKITLYRRISYKVHLRLK